MGIIFFLLGASFAYFVIVPISIEFFTSMSINEIQPLFSFGNYLGFISSLLLSFGLVFELSMIVVLLTQLNLVSSNTFKKHRKLVILAIFVVAAILTPPDVVSQTLMALPMVILYEFSIVMSTIIDKRKNHKKYFSIFFGNLFFKTKLIIAINNIMKK